MEETGETVFEVLGEERAEGLLELFNDDINTVLKQFKINIVTSRWKKKPEARKLSAGEEKNLNSIGMDDLIPSLRIIGDTVIFNSENDNLKEGTYGVTLEFYNALAIAKFAKFTSTLVRWINDKIPQKVEKELKEILSGHFSSHKLVDGIWQIGNIKTKFLIESQEFIGKIQFGEIYENDTKSYSVNISISFEMYNVEEIMPGGKLYEEAKERFKG